MAICMTVCTTVCMTVRMAVCMAVSFLRESAFGVTEMGRMDNIGFICLGSSSTDEALPQNMQRGRASNTLM